MSCRFCALLVVVAIAPFAALAQQPGTSAKPGISGSLTSTAPAMPADALQVLDLERKIGEAIVRGDTAFYDRVTAEDFVMTHSDRWTTGGIPLLVDNKASFRKRIENRSYLTL